MRWHLLSLLLCFPLMGWAQNSELSCKQLFSGKLTSLRLRPHQEAVTNSSIALIARGIDEVFLTRQDHAKLGFFSPFFEEQLPFLLNWALPSGHASDEIQVLFRPHTDHHWWVALHLYVNPEGDVMAKIRGLEHLESETQSEMVFSQWAMAHSSLGPAGIYQSFRELHFGDIKVERIVIPPQTQMKFDFGTVDGEFYSHKEVETLLNKMQAAKPIEVGSWLAKVFHQGALYSLRFSETLTNDGVHVFSLMDIIPGSLLPED